MHSHHHHGGKDAHSGHDHGNMDLKRLQWVFLINITFALIEAIGGVWTHSLAILSDALHDFGDSLSLGLAWYFQRLSRKRGDATYSYGYSRFSVMGALTNSLILAAGAVLILRESIPRLLEPGEPYAEGMLILSVAGLIFNGVAFFMLARGSSLNEKVVRLHLLEDVLGWVAVLAGSLVMIFFPWAIIDPILSICISLYMLFNVYKVLKGVFRIFLQGTPEDIHPEVLEKEILKHEEVEGVHDLHVWTLDGNTHILTTHIVLNRELPLEAVANLKAGIRNAIRSKGVVHVTLEVEIRDEDCAPPEKHDH